MSWSLTGWLDPVFKWFADQAGIKVDEYSSRVGGEVIATTGEYGSDLFARPLLARTVQFFSGLGSILIGTWTRIGAERLRMELIQIGTHLLLRVGQPTSLELFALRRNVDDIINAVQRQDWDKLMKNLVYSPPEVQTAFLTFFGIPSPRPPAPPVEKGTYTPPTPTAETPYTPPAETTPETPPTGPKGRYQITE